MVEELLATIADIFADDRWLMGMAAVGVAMTGIVFIMSKIATAHNDVQRRVANERSGAAPPSQTLAAQAKPKLWDFGRFVSGSDTINEGEAKMLRGKLMQAGFFAREAVLLFFALRVVVALVLAAVAAGIAYFWVQMSLQMIGIAALVAAVLGYLAPTIGLDRLIERRRREHRSGFPDFMDLMVVCAQAGLSMEASISRIGAEIGAAFPSLARNLDLTTREMRGGKPVSRAVESLAIRLGIDEAMSFATLLQQSEELGSSLTQSLRAYSDDMRNKRLMKAEEKAYSLPAKLVVPLTLFVFPVLLVVLMLPVVISVSQAKL